jgi:hypothetical protein
VRCGTVLKDGPINPSPPSQRIVRAQKRPPAANGMPGGDQGYTRFRQVDSCRLLTGA